MPIAPDSALPPWLAETALAVGKSFDVPPYLVALCRLDPRENINRASFGPQEKYASAKPGNRHLARRGPCPFPRETRSGRRAHEPQPAPLSSTSVAQGNAKLRLGWAMRTKQNTLLQRRSPYGMAPRIASPNEPALKLYPRLRRKSVGHPLSGQLFRRGRMILQKEKGLSTPKRKL